MKCRIKSTGEIVDVINWSINGAYTDYIDKDGIEVSSILNYYKDFELILENNIDYEQRRYEIAKAILTGYSSGEGFYSGIDRTKEHCERAIMYADELIRQLKQ